MVSVASRTFKINDLLIELYNRTIDVFVFYDSQLCNKAGGRVRDCPREKPPGFIGFKSVAFPSKLHFLARPCTLNSKRKLSLANFMSILLSSTPSLESFAL